MNLKVAFLIVLIIITLLPLLIRDSHASTPAGTITYSAGTDTITVIGANSSHPAEFLDLYNADVAGGWGGQVVLQGVNQFQIDCRLVLGNGSAATYFTDTGKQVTWLASAVSGNYQRLITITSGAVLTLGVLNSAVNKGTSKGVSIQSYDTNYCVMIDASGSTSVVNLYSCSFAKVSDNDGYLGGTATGASITAYNCLFSRVILWSQNVPVWNVYNGYCALQGLDSSTGTFNGFTVQSSTYAFTYSGSYISSDLTVTNAVTRNCTKTFDLSGVGAYDINMVDPDFDAWAFTWSGTNTATVNRQYSFNLFVLNGALTDFVEDANVTLSHDGAVVGSWLTNSTGQVDTQILTYGFYNQTGGDTMYGGTAWTLTITHPDWETYTSAFYPYSKIEWSISMQDTTTTNNNMLLAGLMVGTLCFAGFIVYIKRN